MKNDCFILLCFDDIVDILSGVKYFSKFDFRFEYWQVEIVEKDKYNSFFGR